MVGKMLSSMSLPVPCQLRAVLELGAGEPRMKAGWITLHYFNQLFKCPHCLHDGLTRHAK